MEKYYSKYKFNPKKPVRSFRDLEVYQKTQECAVVIAKDLRPLLLKLQYPLLDNMINCCLSIPLHIAESHSLRFADFDKAISFIENGLASCNKIIVYLEQIRGIYGAKLDADLIEDLICRYLAVRGKMFRLEMAWKRFGKMEKEQTGRITKF